MILKTKVPLESFEQEQIFRWRDENKHKYPEIALLHSSGNGLRLTPGAAVKAKKQGLTAGAPDIFLPVAMSHFDKKKDDYIDYYGLFIELKRIKGGKISPEQQIFITALENQGYKAVVCYGSDEAIKTIKNYLGIKE